MTRAGLPLAVFALILQAVVAFAHHHVPDAHPHQLAHRAGDAAVARLLLQTEPAACPSDHRAAPAPVLPADEFCFLCTVIHAAAAPAADALLPGLPVVYARLREAPPAVSVTPPQRVAAFDPRGPPRA